MSARAVATAWHRMIVDEWFAAWVARDPFAALADRGLTAAEQGWLAQLDTRAVALEGGRATNLLAALLPAFPVSSAWLVGADLRRFLSSGEIVGVIERRGDAAEAFGRWLAARARESSDPRAAVVVSIEAASVAVQRAPVGTGGEMLARSPGCALLDLPEGGVAAWQELAAWVGDPVVAMAKLGRRAPVCPTLGPGRETAAVVGRSDGSTVEVLNEAVADWLRSLHGPQTRPEAVAGLIAFDLSEPEAGEVIDDALAAGWLHAVDGTA